MCRENKSDTFDLSQLKISPTNPFGLSELRDGMSRFPARECVCVCAIIIAVQRLIGPMHINSLKCLPAGIHFKSGPHLLEGCPTRFLGGMWDELFPSNI